MAVLFKRFNVVRKIESKTPSGRPFWAPVGQLTLFADRQKGMNGKLRLNILGDEFHVFPEKSQDAIPTSVRDEFDSAVFPDGGN